MNLHFVTPENTPENWVEKLHAFGHVCSWVSRVSRVFEKKLERPEKLEELEKLKKPSLFLSLTWFHASLNIYLIVNCCYFFLHLNKCFQKDIFVSMVSERMRDVKHGCLRDKEYIL